MHVHYTMLYAFVSLPYHVPGLRKDKDGKLSDEKSQAGRVSADDAEKGTSKGVTGSTENLKPESSGKSTKEAGKGPEL